MAADPVGGAMLGGMNLKPPALGRASRRMPVDRDGVPFDMWHIYASGNIAADMIANVTAESTGRILAVRLYNMTDDPGMKDMLPFLIARDTMHQNQWLAALEELGGPRGPPDPEQLPAGARKNRSSATLSSASARRQPPAEGRWSKGTSIDGKGKFTAQNMAPLGEVPDLGPARPTRAPSPNRSRAARGRTGLSAGGEMPSPPPALSGPPAACAGGPRP